jgi:hypothetical protein
MSFLVFAVVAAAVVSQYFQVFVLIWKNSIHAHIILQATIPTTVSFAEIVRKDVISGHLLLRKASFLLILKSAGDAGYVLPVARLLP